MVDIDHDSRSVSQDFDSDNDGDGLDGNAPGKPGRKKNPNSAAARRDQNRIAQREFRLRKQQRIRDLEARVEILSGSKDETFSELRDIVKDLMQENLQLRNLIRSLGNYIGDGLGGVLPSIGFDRPQEFIDFINKAETDTAFEGFQRRKKAAQQAASQGNGIASSLSRKRTASEDDNARKRSKGFGEQDRLSLNGKDHTDTRFSMLVPISPAGTGSGGSFYSPGNTTAASASYMTGPAVGDSPNYGASPGLSGAVQFPSAFQPQLNVQSALGSQAFLPSAPLAGPSGMHSTPQSDANDHEESAADDPKLQEATKLIHYHLDNYKRNNAYCLPQSLRPTLVQRSVPHESVIDSIPHPELRDRLILLRSQFDLVDALHDYAKNLTLHGDDVLAHSNWEVSENWLRQYHYLVDQSMLNISNRWRRERGEPELLMTDINPPDSQPAA